MTTGLAFGDDGDEQIVAADAMWICRGPVMTCGSKESLDAPTCVA
jgi:hypothetical protein